MRCTSAFAQRYLPGMRGVEAIGGLINGSGYYVHAGWAKYTFKKNRYFINAEFLQRNYNSEVGTIPVQQFTGGIGYYKRLLSDYTQSAVLAAGVTALMGYETVNWNKKLLPNGGVLTNKDAIIYGFEFDLEFEYYVDDRYVLLGTIKQRACAGSSVRMAHTLFGIGIKYILE
ncbi:conjugal transfer protein [Bacteroidia bacterium]|nr:conjugal transfer protein [Bacteroidia bacterium]